MSTHTTPAARPPQGCFAGPGGIAPLNRKNHRRADGLSGSLQLAKAAEHLVCAELILQGWNAFLADAGLPYDVLADGGAGQFWRVQVKSTCDPMSERLHRRPDGARVVRPVYRFALRKSRCGDRRITLNACDWLALVALDVRAVAWLPVSAVLLPDGRAVSAVEFKARHLEYARRGVSGPDPAKCGRFLEDFARFNPPGGDV
jgi:hypothetical protein